MRQAATTIALAIASALLSGVCAGAERARQWRPSTVPPAAPRPATAPVADPPGASTPAPASGQRAYIDPITDTVVPAPVSEAAEFDPRLGRGPVLDFSLRRTPEGYLYIDTTGYEHAVTATLDPDGTAHVNCIGPTSDPGHGHAAPAPAKSATPDRRQ